MRKQEDEANLNIATSYAEQNLVAKGAKKFNDVRSTLNSKINNIYSYVILVSAISNTANSLYKLADEYKDFTVNTYNNFTKKPFILWYYTNANYQIYKEVKHCQKLYSIFAASGVNIWRAPMDDKYNLLYRMHATVEQARGIIRQANLFCEWMVNGTYKPDYIWEILDADATDEIAQSLILNWSKGS
jgi:hypothetical protein